MVTGMIRSSSAYTFPGIMEHNYNEYSIVRDVCNYFGVPYGEIKSRSRFTKVRLPRQVAMYFVNKMFPKLGSVYIGSMFDRNHATALHSFKAVENMIFTQPDFRHNMNELERIIKISKGGNKIVE
jgi:chromosomal replication initiator protein